MLLAEVGGVGVEDYFISHAGIRDNPGISVEARAAMLRMFANNPSQLAARDQGQFVKPEGLVFGIFDATNPLHLSSIPLERAIWLLKRCTIFSALDPGKLRFAWGLFGITPEFQVILFDEIFDQYGSLDDRARLIAGMMVRYEIKRRFPIYADCANPTDIDELNSAFKRLKERQEDFPLLCSAMRAIAVGADKKLIKPGIQRCESLIQRGLFMVRKESGEAMTWKLNWRSNSEGVPQIGSRFLFEIGQWAWPSDDKELNKAQKEIPDDNTADGADMMAMLRYGIMSALKPGKEPPAPDREAFSPEAMQEDADKARTIKHRMKRRREGPADEVERSLREY